MTRPQDRETGAGVRAERRPRRGLALGVILAGLLGLLLVGATALSASLASAAPGWWGHEGHRRWGHFRGGPHDPERARERAELAVGWVLRYVDASDEQERQVQAIVGDTAEQLLGLAGQHHAHREAFVSALLESDVDRAELEAIRRAELELAEVASAQLIDALADVAEVLTPEQRQQLVELAQHFHR